MLRIAGPAVGGLTVHALGPGPAFFGRWPSSSFGRPGRPHGPAARATRAAVAGGLGRTLADVGEGLAFVRANPWCSATLLAAMLAMLAF